MTLDDDYLRAEIRRIESEIEEIKSAGIRSLTATDHVDIVLREQERQIGVYKDLLSRMTE